MKPCNHRQRTETGFLCHSPKLITLGEIDGSVCAHCPYAETANEGFFQATNRLTTWNRPKHKPKPCGGCGDRKAAKQLENALREPINNGDWTVAVTTAPRKNCTLIESIESIRDAGWEPIVFAEPGSTKTTAKTVENKERKGVWHNWRDSAAWCLKNTDSQLILTVQDDSIFHPESRAFAESILWPSPDAAFVSLYTPKHYSINSAGDFRPAGVNRIRTRSLWGACALIWDRRVLEAVIYHKTARGWLGAPTKSRKHWKGVRDRRRQEPWTIANSDTAIGKICNSLRRPMYFVDPSPVSHVAVHSTIGHGGNKGRRNCYRCSDHETPLREQIPAPKNLFHLGTGPKHTGEALYDAARERWHRLGYSLSMTCSQELWRAIEAEVRPNDRTVEFGCGVSTSAFQAAAKHSAIDSDKRQAARFRSGVYRPVRDGWYDYPTSERFRVMLVDGPYREKRSRGLDWICEHAADGAVIFVDDVDRPDERRLADGIAERLGKQLTIHGDGRQFAVLRDPHFDRNIGDQTHESL